MIQFFVTLILTFVMTVGMLSVAYFLTTLFPAPQKPLVMAAIVMGVSLGALFVVWLALVVKP